MSWYDEHVEHGEGVRRPYVRGVGAEVHRLVAKVEDGALPQGVVQERHDVHQFVEGLDDVHGVSVEGDAVASELTVVHVEAALDYARDHRAEVRAIIEEQERLDEVVLSCPPEQAYEVLQSADFEYFDVDPALHEEDGGVRIEYGIE